LKKFIIQILINAVAFFAAITIMRGHGIEAQGNVLVDYLLLGLIFSIINAVLRPIVSLLGCPVIILTLGLGILLINTLLFYLTGLIGESLGVGFTVDGFVPAFLGALIVSVVGMVLNVALHREMKD
jgi:putative membrane protein